MGKIVNKNISNKLTNENKCYKIKSINSLKGGVIMKKDETFFEYPTFDNIREVIYYSVKRYPENLAFIVKHKNTEDNKDVTYENITYKEFLKQVNALGTGLYNLGMKGKRIAIISKNRYEWVLSFVSLLLGGIVAVPIDKDLEFGEFENSLVRSKADAIIFDSKYEDSLKEIRANGKTNLKEYICMDESKEFKNLQKIKEKGQELIDSGNDKYIKCDIDNNALAELVFTSGTTSESKVVMLSNYNLARNISDMQLVEDFRESDVNLAFLPLHHTFGSTGQLIMLSSGLTTAFPDGLRYIAQNLKEYHVTFFVGVPLLIESIYKKLNKEIEKQGKTKLIKALKVFTNFLLKLHIDIRRKVYKSIIDELGGLRFVISGAAALDKEVEKGFNDLGILTVQGYGLTEASPVLIAENYKYRRYGSIGFPMPSVKVKIVDKNEEGVGELIAKAPNVMMGYYEDEVATNETIKDGWLYTGDLAYIDKDGFVYITGRKKNVVVLKNGKNIYPEELEFLINKLDIVKDSMVFGIPKEDDLLLSAKVQYDEEYVKANYPDADEEKIEKIIWEEIKEINKTLPTYKYIKNLIVTKEEFIKTTTAKIKRHEEMKRMS